MTRKLIAFDIDGTLVRGNQEILASTVETIKTLQNFGHLVTIATGRSLLTAQVVIDALDFEHYVLCNGGYAFLDHQQVHSQPIDKEELKLLVSLANQKKFDLLYQTMNEVKQQGPFIHQKNYEMQASFTSEMPSYDFNIDQEEAIYQAILFCNRQEEAEITGYLKKIRFTRWGEDAMDAVPIGVSKATTLATIANSQGIATKNIVAFGDGENDIEMLQLAGTGIAMGNATDYVKSFASHVTASNEEDGIWQAAKHHQLI